MSNKEQLKAYIYAKERIADAIEEIETLQCEVLRITPILDDMPKGSGCHDKTQIIDSYLEMIDDLQEEIKDLQQIKKKVKRIINSIDDQTIRRILGLRYICGMRWEVICVKVSYSWRQTHYLHAKGLKMLDCIELH